MGCTKSVPMDNKKQKPDETEAPKDNVTPMTSAPAASTPSTPDESKKQGTMNLGDQVPNFDVVTTKGNFKLHEYFGPNWGILFSHPADFTPVCSTELNTVQKYLAEFTKRNCKVIALSCDDLESHNQWVPDVVAVDAAAGQDLDYPIIADPTRDLASKLGMLDAVAKDAAGLPQPARSVFVFGPDKSLKLSLLYPATTGRNFDEIIRALTSLQLTAYQKLATPVNWKTGEEAVITPAVSGEEAPKLFPGFRTVELPSKKEYLRMTKPTEDMLQTPEAKEVPAAGKTEIGLNGGLNLGDVFPNDTVETSKGQLNIHEYFGDSWGLLCSHPADFTPVCTTELSELDKLLPEFTKRSVKVMAVSCDSAESHKAWIPDILSYEGCAADKELDYPIIADPNRELAYKLGMLDAVSKDAAGLPLTARAVFVVNPMKKVALSILYPATTGRNLDEVLRVIDSLQLTAQHKLATPANWTEGQPCIITPAVSQEEAPKLFPKGVTVMDLPSKKPYLRYTPDPRKD